MTTQVRRIFSIANILCFLTAVGLLLGTYRMGRFEFFRYLNRDLGAAGDFIFGCATWLGDGVVWVPMIILTFLYRRPWLLLSISAIVISTIITQAVKHLFFPGLPRPTLAMEIHLYKIHTVPGVELLTVDSFPSGHTATAFSVFLVACLLVRRWWILPVGFVYALLVGYSRIYLAQHFPLDVAGGILAAVISVSLSLLIQQKWKPQP